MVRITMAQYLDWLNGGLQGGAWWCLPVGVGTFAVAMPCLIIFVIWLVLASLYYKVVELKKYILAMAEIIYIPAVLLAIAVLYFGEFLNNKRINEKGGR